VDIRSVKGFLMGALWEAAPAASRKELFYFHNAGWFPCAL
jgi:hypothetical protein